MHLAGDRDGEHRQRGQDLRERRRGSRVETGDVERQMRVALGANIARLPDQMRGMVRQVELHIDVRGRLRRRTRHIDIDIRRRPGDAELLILDQDLTIDQVNPPQAAELALIVRFLDETFQYRAEISPAIAGAELADAKREMIVLVTDDGDCRLADIDFDDAQPAEDEILHRKPERPVLKRSDLFATGP